MIFIIQLSVAKAASRLDDCCSVQTSQFSDKVNCCTKVNVTERYLWTAMSDSTHHNAGVINDFSWVIGPPKFMMIALQDSLISY